MFIVDPKGKCWRQKTLLTRKKKEKKEKEEKYPPPGRKGHIMRWDPVYWETCLNDYIEDYNDLPPITIQKI